MKEGFLFDVNIPQKTRDIIGSDPFLSELPEIYRISSVSGGVAHYVYKISSGETSYYLKIRGDRFFQIPEIAINPADIAIEHKALRMFGKVAPENFPQVLSFSEDKFYLVLTNAIPNGDKIETLFLEQKATRNMLFNLGATLKKIHDGTNIYSAGLREDDDTFKYDELLSHRFGYRHNLALDELTGRLRSMGKRQLVLGDASPKNIGANNGGELIVFFDLETAHKGDTVFDYAYLLGHILLHTLPFPEKACEGIESYLKGYGDAYFDPEIVKKIALGIILYRLGSIIPYPTGLSSEKKPVVEKKVEEILALNLQSATWPEVIALLSYE